MTETPMDLTLSVGEVAEINPRKRTITGVLIPGGESVGTTSAGPTAFSGPESVAWHAELRRIKLLREHQTAEPLGYATALAWDESGALVGTFYLPPTPEGDRALADAEQGLRDGLSVGIHGIDAAHNSAGVLVVNRATLREVSLVSVPAFDDSRVAAVASYRKEVPSMNAEQENQGVALVPPAVPIQVTASDLADELVERLRSGVVSMEGPNSPSAEALNAGAQATGMSLAGFSDLVASHQLGNPDASVQLRAALSDIVPGDMPAAFRPAYLDELWEGASYQRRFIDAAMVVKPLPKAMKIIGQRWNPAPEVDDYAGDKGPIPSNEPVLSDVEVNVQRLAGGHDVDRAFIDLGSPAWIASYFEAQAEDVKRKSDARAAQIVYAGGTALTTSPTTVMGAVIDAVVDMAAAGETVDYVAMAPQLVRELLEVTQPNQPAFMSGSFQLGGSGDGSLGGVRFVTSGGLTGSQVVVGAKSASRWHEFATPIRVQALNVPNGGIDLGVFQYYAGYVRNPAAVRTAEITGP